MTWEQRERNEELYFAELKLRSVTCHLFERLAWARWLKDDALTLGAMDALRVVQVKMLQVSVERARLRRIFRSAVTARTDEGK